MIAIRLRRRHVRRAAFDIVGILAFLALIFPIYWMVATAFKPGRDILRFDPKWFPAPAVLANFADAISRENFWNSVRTSLIVVISVVVISTVVAFLAAVGTARFGFRGRRAFVVMILVVQMIPLTALVIPIYLQLNNLELTDTVGGVIVSYLAFILPFMVWTLRGFLANIPVDLEEAAMVDGCSRMGAFLRNPHGRAGGRLLPPGPAPRHLRPHGRGGEGLTWPARASSRTAACCRASSAPSRPSGSSAASPAASAA